MSRILIVEDQADLRRGITEMLRYEGFEVMQASDPEAGLTSLETFHPDLILSDLGFAGFDGVDFIQQVRQMAAFAETPILAVTAFNDQEHIDAAVAAGADGYLVKPVVVNDLIQTIRRHIGK